MRAANCLRIILRILLILVPDGFNKINRVERYRLNHWNPLTLIFRVLVGITIFFKDGTIGFWKTFKKLH